MILLRDELASDCEAREALLDRAFGAGRRGKPSELLRRRCCVADDLALVAEVGGVLAGTVRLWEIEAGGVPALLLGPLATDPDRHRLGIGSALMRLAIYRAGAAGHEAIVLVGDEAYYRRFGFSRCAAAGLGLAGPHTDRRLLGLALREGALDAAWGSLRPAPVAAEAASQKHPSDLSASAAA